MLKLILFICFAPIIIPVYLVFKFLQLIGLISIGIDIFNRD